MKSMELFFELMDYEFLILAVEKKNICINGFTSIRKAPKNLIRNVIKKRFCNKKKFQELVCDIFDEKSVEYKGSSIETFIKDFYMCPGKNKYSTFDTYGIFINLFPNEAEKLCDKISINIESGKHIFSGLLACRENITEENCLSIIERQLDIEYEENLEKVIETIEDMLLALTLKNEYEIVKKSIENKSMVDICREIGDFSEFFDEGLLWLAFISLNLDFVKKDKNKLRFFTKILINIKSKINAQYLDYNRDKIKSLEEECQEKSNEISILNKNINDLESHLLFYKDTLDVCENSIKELSEKIMHNTSFSVNESEPDIIVITNYVNDRIMDALGNYLIISPKDIDGNNILEDFKGIVFIDRGSISSTKWLLEIEDYFEKLKLKRITIFEESIEKLVESILINKFVLEG